jgi:hypothetical protein
MIRKLGFMVLRNGPFLSFVFIVFPLSDHLIISFTDRLHRTRVMFCVVKKPGGMGWSKVMVR